MIKRLILSMLLIVSFMGVKAQQNPAIPLDPNVIHGVLPNGLTYYILHNEEPKNRANFYIAQKVGSSLENQDQLGLAHFLEHMAFNGTENFPDSTLLDYLQSKGIRFGADINAYTGFDETVYNINNVPTNDQALMDSVLLALHDWSGYITLSEKEIDKERGVIVGEYTQGNNAFQRMFTVILPKLYKEYQYQQTPIGKMEIVKNFPPQAIRDYYKKWYRPDLQGIVIVGDFDAKEMEKKVIALFSEIPMPENAAERVYPTISKNEQPIYVTFEDPELQSPTIETFFKFERTPFEERNTVMGFLFDQLAPVMVEQMINNRLEEYAMKADCPYSYAKVDIGTYMVSPQEGSFNVSITPKTNYEEAYSEAMGIVVRACKTGFMGTEVQRVRDQLLANYETRFNERDKTNSEVLGREIIENFTDNAPYPGIEKEYEFIKMLLPGLPEEFYNEYASQLIHIDNVAVLIYQPTTVELNIPEENAFIASLNNIINADYEPYVDEVITEPLISKMPKAGKIKSKKTDSKFGTTEYTLSNGMRVIVKPTDYANDEILFQIFKEGGVASYPASESNTILGQALAIEVSNIGPFNPTRLGKYLAGKNVSINYNVGNSNNYFSGNSTVKDVATMFELIYACFTDVTPDQETYDAFISQIKTFLANQESNPEFIFRLKARKDIYPNTPALYPMTLSTVDGFNYDKILGMYHESVKNAADYTMIIVGNVDEKTIEPLLTQYIASLPSTGKKSAVPNLSVITPAQGQINDTFDIPSQSPSVFVIGMVNQNDMPYSVKDAVMIDLLGDVLDMIYTETLREEMGGTYSPSASAALNPYTSSWTVQYSIVTSEEYQQAIIERANSEFKKLMSEGTDMAHFSKVREAAIKQLDNYERNNQYWLGVLLWQQRGFDSYTGKRAALENLTLDDFNKFITSIYNGKNKIEIVGVAK